MNGGNGGEKKKSGLGGCCNQLAVRSAQKTGKKRDERTGHGCPLTTGGERTLERKRRGKKIQRVGEGPWVPGNLPRKRSEKNTKQTEGEKKKRE